MISIQECSKEDIAEFDQREWKAEDIAHYGETVNWIEKKFVFKAMNGNQIVGSAKGKFESGVVNLDTLIVAQDARGEGVGKKLLEKIIDFGKKMGGHKIYLYTMPHWESYKFYIAQGFEQVAQIPNHYLKRDFVIMEKNI
jgi:ribosomal protein S18 acetylase RimI-like enzyme